MHRQPLGKSESLGTKEWMCGELPGVPSTPVCPSCCHPGPQLREMGCVVSYRDWREEHSPSALSFVGMLDLV